MTAAAMIVGMAPMAIGGPGEEQNAVLARAVIGGVVVGTNAQETMPKEAKGALTKQGK
jgi:multidrug efflux pump subunit AcrB